MSLLSVRLLGILRTEYRETGSQRISLQRMPVLRRRLKRSKDKAWAAMLELMGSSLLALDLDYSDAGEDGYRLGDWVLPPKSTAQRGEPPAR